MRRILFTLVILPLLSAELRTQTSDEIITKYINTVGGLSKIRSTTTLIRTGKFIGGGGFEAAVRTENKRPDFVREEFTIQGMTAVNAYDGFCSLRVVPNGWNKFLFTTESR